MRLKKDVLKVITDKTNEIDRINKLIENKDFSEGSIDYYQDTVWNLMVARAWCEWFLNVKKNRSVAKVNKC